jgi:hypothetical protein
LEAAVAVIVIMLYLAAFKSERQRLRLSLADIKDIAFETTEVAAAQEQGAAAQSAEGTKESPDRTARNEEAWASKEAGKLQCLTCGSCIGSAGGRGGAQLQRADSTGGGAVRVVAWHDGNDDDGR